MIIFAIDQWIYVLDYRLPSESIALTTCNKFKHQSIHIYYMIDEVKKKIFFYGEVQDVQVTGYSFTTYKQFFQGEMLIMRPEEVAQDSLKLFILKYQKAVTEHEHPRKLFNFDFLTSIYSL